MPNLMASLYFQGEPWWRCARFGSWSNLPCCAFLYFYSELWGHDWAWDKLTTLMPNDHFPPIHPLDPPARYFHSWVLRVCPDDACEAEGQPAEGAPDWLKVVAAGPPPLIVMPDICWVIWVWKEKRGGWGWWFECLNCGWKWNKSFHEQRGCSASAPLLCLASLFTFTSAAPCPLSLPSVLTFMFTSQLFTLPPVSSHSHPPFLPYLFLMCSATHLSDHLRAMAECV